MPNYRFTTIQTMKPYNADKWWIDEDYIPSIVVEADSMGEALCEYVETVEEYGVSVSKNALKTKSPMYRGDEQVGYVITGKTSFRNDEGWRDGRYWVDQYINLWVEITEWTYPTFSRDSFAGMVA